MSTMLESATAPVSDAMEALVTSAKTAGLVSADILDVARTKVAERRREEQEAEANLLAKLDDPAATAATMKSAINQAEHSALVRVESLEAARARLNERERREAEAAAALTAALDDPGATATSITAAIETAIATSLVPPGLVTSARRVLSQRNAKDDDQRRALERAFKSATDVAKKQVALEQARATGLFADGMSRSPHTLCDRQAP